VKKGPEKGQIKEVLKKKVELQAVSGVSLRCVPSRGLRGGKPRGQASPSSSSSLPAPRCPRPCPGPSPWRQQAAGRGRRLPADVALETGGVSS